MTKQEALKAYFGYDSFREGQEALIDALLSGHDALGVMPTGAGKSLCYQVPALVLGGVALVVSPLISLMKDQVAALKAAGVPAAYINSSLTLGQQREALRRAAAGAYRIIYVAPERLDVPEFLAFAKAAPLSLIAVDEAHCVSQWGQDFRPSYLKIADFVALLPKRPPIGAYTATATPQVKADMARLLKLNAPVTRVTGFDRPNLRLACLRPRDKFAALMDVVGRHAGESGIVYCQTRKGVEEVTERLTAEGISATRYHAGLGDEERMRNQDDFQYDRKAVIVATNAFGMGIDKSNVSFVAHYNMPRSMESYYQEAGRAGRDGSPAECVLLYGAQDVVTGRWMIEHSEPSPELTADEQAELFRRDMERLKQMTFYCTGRKCLRQFILNYFGEKAGGGCGNCSVCLGEAMEPEEENTAVSRAQTTGGAHARGGHTQGKLASHASHASAHTAKPTHRPFRGTARDALDEEAESLFAELKALRARLAAEKHVPPYVIFNDATLRDMAEKRPRDWEGFARVSGVGSRKRDRYGDVFLATICRREGVVYVPHAPQEEDDDGFDSDAVPSAGRAADNTGRPWNAAEDARLREEFESDATIAEMCEEHERSPFAIRARLRRLGLML